MNLWLFIKKNNARGNSKTAQPPRNPEAFQQKPLYATQAAVPALISLFASVGY